MRKKFVTIFSLILLTLSLTGCTGEQGVQGIQGEPGPKGDKGDDGHSPAITIGNNGNWFIDGVDTNVKAQGDQGIQGIQGEPGEQGLSAYEIFKKYYPEYTGTEQEWITDVALGNVCNLFDHEWDDGTITIYPTATTEGRKTYYCSNCEEERYETIPVIENIYTVAGAVAAMQSENYVADTEMIVTGVVTKVQYQENFDSYNIWLEVPEGAGYEFQIYAGKLGEGLLAPTEGDTVVALGKSKIYTPKDETKPIVYELAYASSHKFSPIIIDVIKVTN